MSRAAEPSPRFHLVDAMLLVAATAGGLAWARYSLERQPMSRIWASAQPAHRWTAGLISVALAAVLPVLFTWSLTLLAVRLRRPPKHFRNLARQPGFVAGLAAAVSLTAVAMRHLPSLFLLGRSRPYDFRYFFLSNAEQPGFAVMGSWLTLALVRAWRPEPSWIDRTGRALGVGWLVAAGLNILRIALQLM